MQTEYTECKCYASVAFQMQIDLAWCPDLTHGGIIILLYSELLIIDLATFVSYMFACLFAENANCK